MSAWYIKDGKFLSPSMEYSHLTGCDRREHEDNVIKDRAVEEQLQRNFVLRFNPVDSGFYSIRQKPLLLYFQRSTFPNVSL